MSTTDKRPLKVFLCHASTDKPKVRELYRYLKKRGIQPWFDEEDLVGGQDWQVEIPKALATSDAIIICLTKNSVDKEGYIQKEIKFALDKALEMPEGRIFLIPVKFEECEVPFTLSRYQWVDLTVESGYAKMIKALKFRASQLERSTVEINKKDIEEKEEQKEIKSGKLEEKRKLTEKPIQEGNDKTQRADAWFAVIGLIVIVSIVYFSSLRNRQPNETNQPQISDTLTFTETVKPSATSTPKSTSTPSITLTPTSLPTEITDAEGVSMVLVPAGEFTMGSERYTNEKPLHLVYLSAFYMDVYEVTNAAYKVCVDANVCTPPQSTNSLARFTYYGNKEFDDYPVIRVDWDQAKTYCEWRQASLPTEAQWEKSSRGIDGRTFPWGEVISCSYTNYLGCNKVDNDTLPVGSFEAGKSPYGIYNLAGNVWEWVSDWYLEDYYQTSPYIDPLGPESGVEKILRGGGYSTLGAYMRSYYRGAISPTEFRNDIGFRCAKGITP